MKSYIQQLEEYVAEKGITNLNVATAHSMGVGEKPTEEQLAKETLEMLKATESGDGVDVSTLVL